MQLTENCTYYSAKLINVGKNSQKQSYVDNIKQFWKLLKDDYSEEKIITVTTPDNKKTFIRKFEEEPEGGVLSVLYSCNDEKFNAVYFLTNHSFAIGIDSLHDKNDKQDQLVKALVNSFNQALAKYSLEIRMEKSTLSNQGYANIIYFDYMLGDSSIFR